MELIQNLNDCNQHAIHLQGTVCMTMQVEYITFYINNPVKVVTLNQINLYTYNIISIYIDSIVQVQH